MAALSVGAAPVLRDPIDPAVAADQLADWGFLAHADLPDGAGDAYLLVALRDLPTFRHFDPERVELWVTRGGRGVPLVITRSTPVPSLTALTHDPRHQRAPRGPRPRTGRRCQ